MIIKYLVYSIVITYSSWIVGMIANGILIKKAYYKKYKNLSNLNLIKSKTLPKKIGLKTFKWIVKNTFFKYFNQNIKLTNKVDITDLQQVRKEMTYSEISHLIGFGFVAIVALGIVIFDSYLFGLMLMIVNIFMNLYSSLLHQENKKRIDRLMKIYR